MEHRPEGFAPPGAAAFEEVYATHSQAIYYLCLRLLGDPQKAEDAAHDVFLRAYRHLETFRGESSWRTWLYRIAINHCIDFQRKQKNDPCLRDKGSAPLQQPDVADEMPDPEETYIREQRLRLMRDTVDKLKPRYRRLIELRYFDELSYEEIADTLNLPLGTIKAQLFRAKELLYQILAGSREL